MLELFHEILTEIADYAILGFEFTGIVILILAGLKGIRDYVTHNPMIRLILAEGIALSLEFKLASEIIRTVIVSEMSELYFIAGLIILRASLTFLIHWEIDHEEKKVKGHGDEETVNEETKHRNISLTFKDQENESK